MRKVMLVEDEELILQGLKNIIDWQALQMEVVQEAHNGKQALEIFCNHPVDIIVTDVSMPSMDGISLLKQVRKKDQRVRCIILTGFDEFEYARQAIFLDVEDYILKPIDEEKLIEVLKQADYKLQKSDQQKAVSIDDRAGWLRFLTRKLAPEEMAEYIRFLPELSQKKVTVAIMKLELDSLKELNITDVLVELQKKEGLRVIYLASDTLLLLYYLSESATEQSPFFIALQEQLENEQGILCFISVAIPIEDYKLLPAAYEEARKLLKYRMIQGYGSCVFEQQIQTRQSKTILFDDANLRKLIIQKDREGAMCVLEDLFMHQVQQDVSVDDIYRMAIKIALLLQDIKGEYNLSTTEGRKNLTEMVDQIYRVEDILGLKMIFIEDIIEIISCIQENNSQFTPVVKQIMSEVQQHYQEDMNLKTLSHKYHMNASYLGQIFQKEVGCTFAQYLSNVKNGIAKNLILNTNMKINDIAKAVGYPDTSYFYRKFKQCFGVSPASFRQIKQY